MTSVKGFILHYIRAPRLLKKNNGKHSFTLIKVCYRRIPILERFQASFKHLNEWVSLALEIEHPELLQFVYNQFTFLIISILDFNIIIVLWMNTYSGVILLIFLRVNWTTNDTYLYSLIWTIYWVFFKRQDAWKITLYTLKDFVCWTWFFCILI